MKKLIFPILLSAVIFSACEKEDPIIPNEEELITTLIYRLEPLGGGDIVELKFQDLDDGNGPVITSPALKANTQYHGSITLLNEIENPTEDITEEVEKEAEEHQLFYRFTTLKTDFEYMDQDLNDNPIGLITSLSTGSAESGMLTITLRHEPMKPNNGTPEDAGGETDIEVTFELMIE